jgi:hypothetical protein
MSIQDKTKPDRFHWSPDSTRPDLAFVVPSTFNFTAGYALTTSILTPKPPQWVKLNQGKSK